MGNLYLDIGKENQKNLLRALKYKAGFSWTKLAKFLGVGRNTVLMYNSGRHRLPLNSLKRLCELTKTDYPESDLKVIEINNKERLPQFSDFNEDFAEFLGALYGDGCLTNNYSIVITCDATSDRKYVEEIIKPKFIKLFSLESTIRVLRNEIYCWICSKKVFEFISKNFEFPIGKKKGRMQIPKVIYTDTNYSKAFLRGLFDTDGGFHRHHLNSAQIQFTSYDSVLLRQVWQLLIDLNFNAKLGEQDIWIFDKMQIHKFFEEIGPHNQKHLFKYRYFKEKGFVPKHRDIDYLEESVRSPGFEPESRPWQGRSLPLTYDRISPS